VLLIGGSKRDVQPIGPVNVQCPQCGAHPCGLFRLRNRLTLYFIPIVSLGSEYLLKCPNCLGQWTIDRANAERLQRDGGVQPLSSEPAGATILQPGPAGASSLRCAKCGEMLAPNARFCTRCGAPAS